MPPASRANDNRGPDVSSQTVVFRARGLAKTYGAGETAVHALRDVDLDISEGEFIVLLGPSGSGKSTLLNILGGLDAPTSGEARFRDLERRAVTPSEIKSIEPALRGDY
ncbi:MAG: ATP-binding cassette domain-containing protein, partial [Rhabdaerophilum sp.]